MLMFSEGFAAGMLLTSALVVIIFFRLTNIGPGD